MRVCLPFILVLFSWPTWAAPIVVKSGEHGTFTRLVIYLNDGQKWDITDSEGLTTFAIDGWDDGFDISDVFDRIDNRRLKSLTASNERLIMTFGCACNVVTTELDRGFVSLDIRQTPVARSPEPRPVSENVPEIAQTTIIPDPEIVVEDELEWPVLFDELPSLLTLDRIISKNQRSRSMIFENGLGEEISRGATLTYLAPNNIELKRTGSAEQAKSSKSEAELLEILSERVQFSNAGEAISNTSFKPENSCIDVGDLFVSNWGGDKPFIEELARLRGDLYTEFDKLNARAVRDMARFFVHFGLSSELDRFLTEFDEVSDQIVLQSLAEILDSDFNVDSPLVNLSSCEGEIGFWGMLAAGTPDGLTQEKVEDLTSQFGKLPRHLKELTASRLVDIFDSSGFATASNIVRNFLGDEVNFESEIDQPVTLAVDLEILNQDELFELVKKNNVDSPKALVTYLENAFQERVPVTQNIIELTGAYIHQLEGENIAKRLNANLILSLSVLGEHTEALSILFSTDENLQDQTDLTEKLFENMLLTEESSKISELVWRLNERKSLHGLSENLRIKISKFLATRGQPQLAKMLLEEIQNTGEVSEIIAGILALSGRKKDAVNLLETHSDAQINPRLSELVLDENPEAAWKMRDRLSGGAAKRVAWVSRNWSGVNSDDTRADISALIIGFQDQIYISEKPIRDALTVHSDSQEARRILRDLLNSNE